MLNMKLSSMRRTKLTPFSRDPRIFLKLSPKLS